jgi:phage baseplate assembly protein W
MATDFGLDVSTFPDLDPNFTSISGTRVVAESLARRLTTPRGALPFFPDYGTDVRSWLNESVTQDRIATWQRAIEAECLKEERVLSAKASVLFDFQAQNLAVTVSAVTADGPFKLNLSVNGSPATSTGPAQSFVTLFTFSSPTG